MAKKGVTGDSAGAFPAGIRNFLKALGSSRIAFELKAGGWIRTADDVCPIAALVRHRRKRRSRENGPKPPNGMCCGLTVYEAMDVIAAADNFLESSRKQFRRDLRIALLKTTGLSRS